MPGSLILHVVRHGESTDNLKSLWAGHRDAPLSQYGNAQAERLGDSMAPLKIARIYCSDLKRAHWTAIQVHQRNKGGREAIPPAKKSGSLPSSPEKLARPDSPGTLANDRTGDDGDAAAAPAIGGTLDLPAPITTQLLREQNFGAAEGQPWSTGPYAHHDWSDYRFKFDGGEALVDVGSRADEVVQRVVLPWVVLAASGSEDLVVVMVAHGIMISQLAQALLRQSTSPKLSGHFGGLMNTSYHTFSLKLADPPAVTLTPADFPADQLPKAYVDPQAQYTLRIERVAEIGHLDGLKRQKGGIGRMAYDSSQQSLTSFFGGGGNAPSPKRAARA